MTKNPILNYKIWNVKDKNLLHLILCRDGGKTTAKIIDLLLQKPYNKNQIAKILNLNYNTITYHLKIMCKYHYMEESRIGNKKFFEPTPKLTNNIEEYNIIKQGLTNSTNWDNHDK